MNAEIHATYGRMRNSSNDDEVRKVMEMLCNLKLNLRENDSLRASVDENVTASDVGQWFDVEDNDGAKHQSQILRMTWSSPRLQTQLEILRIMNAKARLAKLRRRLLRLRSCRLCSVQFRNRHFYVTYPMRVLTFRDPLIYLERQFAGLTQTQRGSCSLLRCFRDVPKSFW